MKLVLGWAGRRGGAKTGWGRWGGARLSAQILDLPLIVWVIVGRYHGFFSHSYLICNIRTLDCKVSEVCKAVPDVWSIDIRPPEAQNGGGRKGLVPGHTVQAPTQFSSVPLQTLLLLSAEGTRGQELKQMFCFIFSKQVKSFNSIQPPSCLRQGPSPSQKATTCTWQDPRPGQAAHTLSWD